MCMADRKKQSKRIKNHRINTGWKNRVPVWLILITLAHAPLAAQSYVTITADTNLQYQVMKGFGGSLAYYEGWVTAHPNKSGIYNALFGELSLDILRLRNAHEYDPGMIGRAIEFVQAAEASLGKPIDVLSTSWGPPGRLKSNNDRSNGGTLRYTVTDGTVEFDYPGFANWWQSSLDEYNANGIYPTYISIQNEPDWTATYESCRLNPGETINATDTIAGYNKALQAVYDSVQTREHIPKLLGPETIGIGYNALENYCNQMDLSLVAGIAHHLYHGVDEDDPYASTNFQKVGDYHPEIPHFQSEYSRGNWWSLGGLIYKSLCDEDAVAYLYWDLAWDGDGLVSLDFPWDRSRWSNSVGYTRTKDFYVFKQYSAFIHPGWQRIEAPISADSAVVTLFMSPDKDSAAMVIINRSLSEPLLCNLNVPGFSISRADLYVTSSSENCSYLGDKKDEILEIGTQSIATVAMGLSDLSIAIPVDSIILNPADDSITSRLDSLYISANVMPADASQPKLFWEITSGGSLASITQEGWLKAKGTGNGEVTVRVSATDGSGVTNDTLIILVNQVWVTSIDLSDNPGLIDEPEGTLQLTAIVEPEDAFNKTLSWEIILGGEIADITTEGLLQANGTADGTVEVRATTTDGSGVSATTTIRVTNQVAVTGVTVSPSDTTIDTFMGSVRLQAIVSPQDASDESVSWTILSGSELAMIDPVGRVIAKGKGDGDVTVRATSVSNPEISGEAVVHITNQSDGKAEKMSSQDPWCWTSGGRIHYRISPQPVKGHIYLYSVSGKLLLLKPVDAYKTEGVLTPPGTEDALYVIIVEREGVRTYFKVAVH